MGIEPDNDPYTVRRLRMLEQLTVHGNFIQKKATLMLTWLHIQCSLPKLISATFHVFEFNLAMASHPLWGKPSRYCTSVDRIWEVLVLSDLLISADYLHNSISRRPELVWS